MKARSKGRFDRIRSNLRNAAVVRPSMVRVRAKCTEGKQGNRIRQRYKTWSVLFSVHFTYISDFPVFAIDQRLLIRVGRRGGVVRRRFSAFHARAWLDIVRIVVTIALRFEVFGAANGEILLKQCNIPRVAPEDRNDHVPEDGNHSTTTCDHLIGEHFCCKPIREPRRHKWFSTRGSLGIGGSGCDVLEFLSFGDDQPVVEEQIEKVSKYRYQSYGAPNVVSGRGKRREAAH